MGRTSQWAAIGRVHRPACSAAGPAGGRGQRILAVEAQQVGRSEEAAALQLRLGLAGAGRIGRPEWGVPSATEAGLAEWADAYFTRANAVLWLTGPPPAGLRLPLPDGTPVAVPVGEQVVPAGRHWLLDDGVRAAAVSVLLGDSRAASLIEHVLHQRLFQRLRMDEGIAYDPGVRRSVLGPRHRHLLLTTDTRPDDRLVAAQALVQVVDELAEHGPTESEISACRDEHAAALGHIEVDAVLDRAAARLLLGLPEQSLDELLAEVRALDGESARAGWQQASADALLVVAPGEPVTEPWEPDDWSPSRSGRRGYPSASRSTAARTPTAGCSSPPKAWAGTTARTGSSRCCGTPAPAWSGGTTAPGCCSATTVPGCWSTLPGGLTVRR